MRTGISQFQGQYRFLSNFYPASVFFAGDIYPTVEHAFQAAKCTRAEDRERIHGAATPSEAKRLGRRVELRPDWEGIKVGVMAILVLHKFTFNAELRERLLGTGDAELVEGNTWGDTFWGAVIRGTWPDGEPRLQGENHDYPVDTYPSGGVMSDV